MRRALLCASLALLAAPAAAQPGERVLAWTPAPDDAFALEHVVVDPASGMVFALAPRGAPIQTATGGAAMGALGGSASVEVVAVRLADGSVAWRSSAIGVPLTVRDGDLIATVASGELVRVSPRDGSIIATCAGPHVVGTVGSGLGSWSGLRVVVRDGTTYIVSTQTHREVRGVAPAPGEASPAAMSNRSVVELRAARGTCTTATSSVDPEAALEGQLSLLRAEHGRRASYSIVRARGRPISLGTLTEPDTIGVSGNGVHVVRRGPRSRNTIFDARSGRRVTSHRFSEPIDGLGIVGRWLVAHHGRSVAVYDLASGRLRWSLPVFDPSAPYGGPMPGSTGGTRRSAD